MDALIGFFTSMSPWDWLVQGIGVIAAILGISSFQMKTPRGIVLLQLLGSSMWTLHFLLLGAAAGGILNAIAVFRGLIFYLRNDHKWAAHPAWYGVVGAMLAGATVFSWIYTDGALSLLPLAGMIATTVSLALRDAFRVRAVSFISSPCWLIYNVINASIPGVVTEIFAMCSIIVGILRIDLPKMRRKK